MTYLELVNKVLLRLREREVASVNESAYSKLIGQLVKDANQEVEQAWDWSSLRSTLSATTSSAIFNYELNGATSNTEILNVINDTNDSLMTYKTSADFDKLFLMGTPATGVPQYYSWNGVSADGDLMVDVYPIPDGAYSIRFNMIKRSPEFPTDATAALVPYKPIELLAFAKAVEERGEDGSQTAQSAYRAAERALGDAIAFDAKRHPEELIFAAV